MNMLPKRLPAADESRTANRPTLLLVDDEERILRSLRMLFAADYRVLTSTDGHEALEILERERVQVLISDQRMPKMSGVDLLRQARSVSPATMRLLLTGYADLEAVIGSINEGEVFRYLHKPWHADEIRHTVREAMNIALSMADAPVPALAAACGEVHDILVVDHDPLVARQLRAILEESFPQAYQLQSAANLEQALKLLEHQAFSLVVSEIRVNGEDLAPFLSMLKRYHPQVATIVLTSFQDTTLLMDLINQGQIHRFLPKPIRKTLTLRGIQSGIEHHRLIRQRPEMARRHQVAAPTREVSSTLIGRIRGFFGGPRAGTGQPN